MEVSDGCEQVQSQAKAFSAISVSAAQNAKALQVTQGVFNAHATRGQGAIVRFLGVAEGVMFTFLVRSLAVGMEFIQALIAAIRQQFEIGGHGQTTALEQGKVVGVACTGGDAENLFLVVNHDLPFLSVAFLLAGVEMALFF